MSEFRFILNGVELQDHPDGWEGFTEAIVRDEDLHGITFEYENNLTFIGDGYEILEQQFLSSFCNESILEVEQRCGGGQFTKVLELLLKITDMDTNLNRCQSSAKMTDNNYYGMIHNNREIVVPLDSNKTKNGEPLAPCPTIDISFFLSKLDGSDEIDYLADKRMCYDQRDVINYVIQFITDGRITGYVSNYLDTFQFQAPQNVGIDTETSTQMSFAVLSGTELRRHANDKASVTFSDIINALFTKHNLFWRIEGNKIRFESYEFFFSGNPPVEVFDNQPELIRSVDTNKLFSRVEVGSAEDLPDRELAWGMPFVELIAHAKQSYALSGVCNTDAVLNLITNWVIDSNVIEKVIVDEINASTPSERNQDYDEDVFYMQYFTDSETGEHYACPSVIFRRPALSGSDEGITYNPYITNDNVITRHAVQSSFAIDFADDDDGFLAEFNQGDVDVWIQDFQDDTQYTTELPSSVLSNLNALGYGHGGQWPLQFDWPRRLMGYNASDSNINNEVAVNGANNITFEKDSPLPFFNANGNWKNADADEMYFDAPETGVYGFDMRLLVDKVADRVRIGGAGSPLVPTSEAFSGTFRVMFPRRIQFRVYLCVFDSNDEIVSTHQCPFVAQSGNLSFTENHFLNPGGQTVLDSIFANIGGGTWTNSLAGQQMAATRWNLNTAITDNWNFWSRTNNPADGVEDYAILERARLLYLTQGQRVRIRVELLTVSHIKPRETNFQRWVRYSIMPGSTMGTFYVMSGGGNFAPVNPDLHYALNYAFKRPLNPEQWQNIKDGVIDPILFGKNATDLITGYVSNIRRNLATSESEIELIANRNQPNL